MAYTAWSVVYGEQPTAAKWNQLGTNDAGFKDGTNIDAGAITTAKIADGAVTGIKIASLPTRRQNNTTNTTESTAIIQSGWGSITFGGASAIVSEAVTFPTAFTNRPIVLITQGGDQVSGVVDLGNGASSVHGLTTCKAVSVTTSGFTAFCGQSQGSNYSAGNIVYYHWLAIGV